ncbi:hypothetical protein EP073_02970 [Geovibrio thiophilus]|uniref:Uncharacterized protein n=1 Tax=Geovibrio thiophilus TaxID=139438 RepID=A0A3R5XWK6_9BACT|nr:type II toxin-antitoxin system MqsR family toxin [Geovibrio thiophilus]QAR32397.1 hypothetical protein EP073_02970 [Geovibrio thiophilus]
MSDSKKTSYTEPHYHLNKLKENIRNERYRFTLRAKEELADSETDEDTVIEVILSIYDSEFYKSMESKERQGIYQDVYKVTSELGRMYIKMQENPKDFTVIISTHYGWEE